MTFLNRRTRDTSEPIQFSVVDFPDGAAGADSVIDAIGSWLQSSEMTSLLALFGHRISARTVPAQLAEAEKISRAIFDFRQGGERWEARKVEFTDSATAAAEALIGRIYREPTADVAADLGPVSHALVLGGRLNSCLLRSELLAELAGAVPIAHAWGLGSRREATPGEHDVADLLNIGPISDELDAMAAALELCLGLPRGRRSVADSEPSEVRPLSAGSPKVTALAAEPDDPDKVRATTTDTYRFFLETAEHVGPETPILVVTSAIHGPFQHAQALAALSVTSGAPVMTVGAHIGTSTLSVVRAEWTTAEWLQEIRSAIWSMRLLHDALVRT